MAKKQYIVVINDSYSGGYSSGPYPNLKETKEALEDAWGCYEFGEVDALTPKDFMARTRVYELKSLQEVDISKEVEKYLVYLKQINAEREQVMINQDLALLRQLAEQYKYMLVPLDSE